MFPSKNFFLSVMCFGGKKNSGDLPLGMNSVVNTVYLCPWKQQNNFPIPSLLPAQGLIWPGQISKRNFRNWEPAKCHWSCWCSWGLDKSGWCLAAWPVLHSGAECRFQRQLPCGSVMARAGMQKGLTSMCQGAIECVLTLLHLHCEISWGFPNRTHWLEVGPMLCLALLLLQGSWFHGRALLTHIKWLLLQQQRAN